MLWAMAKPGTPWPPRLPARGLPHVQVEPTSCLVCGGNGGGLGELSPPTVPFPAGSRAEAGSAISASETLGESPSLSQPLIPTGKGLK